MTPPNLPPLLVLTDRTQLPASRSLVEQVEGCIAGGARAVVLREKDLPRDDRKALGQPIKAALNAVGGVLIVASDDELAVDLGAAGVHLSELDPVPPVPRGLVGRSVHSTAPTAHDCHYVTLSPIYSSTSKPGYGPALGTLGLAVSSLPLGVALYALGGIETPELAAECIAAGADGIAVMGALMRAEDPAAATAALLAALEASGCALRNDISGEHPRRHAERTHRPTDPSRRT